MRSIKLTCFFVSLTLLVCCVPVLSVPSASSHPGQYTDAQPALLDTAAFDLGVGIDKIGRAGIRAGLVGASSEHTNGSTALYYVGDYGREELMEFTKRGEGAMCEVWVADDCTFASPSDPRNPLVAITDDQIALMIAEFEDNILPTEATFFGIADPLNGSGSPAGQRGFPTFETAIDGKAMIMVFNIVDEHFYDPACPSYYAGFFSPSLEGLYNRNIIHLDCFDWANRTGSQSDDFPYLYESILAHEYQHLVHYDLDPYEDTFVQEGCSLYAQMVCGYGVPWAYIYYYLCTPDNSLVKWGDQGMVNLMADYGAAALFTIYLGDHFGPSYVSALAADQGVGIEGYDAAFAKTGNASWSFDRAFHAWKLANLIRSDEIGDGWFNYRSINLAAAWPVRTLEYGMHDGMVDRAERYGTTLTADGLDTGVSALGGYGVDYVRFDNQAGRGLGMYYLGFDGDDVAGGAWQLVDSPGDAVDGRVWYSGTGDIKDLVLRGSLDLTGLEEAVLTFRTDMNAQEGRDFCFVQVSIDGGETWTSVGNDRTVAEADLDAEARMRANLPGMTGNVSGELAFDLGGFTGREVLYQFRYMTDSSVHLDGWYIDNVTLNGVVIDNGDDIVSLRPALNDAGFTVTVYAPGYLVSSGFSLPDLIMNVPLGELAEEGSTTMRQLRLYQEVYVVVSAEAGPVDYRFGVHRR